MGRTTRWVKFRSISYWQNVPTTLATASTLRRFHDEFLKSGLIPVSLIRWEMTGRTDEIKQLVKE